MLSALATVQVAAAALSLLVLLRIAQILASNPIGQMRQELVYLRVRQLRQPAIIVFLVLLAELVEGVFPFLERRGIVRPPDDALLIVDTAQILLILVAFALVLGVVRRYTHRALDRRIRESMETLAYLEGQRRRRRMAERREFEPREED